MLVGKYVEKLRNYRLSGKETSLVTCFKLRTWAKRVAAYCNIIIYFYIVAFTKFRHCKNLHTLRNVPSFCSDDVIFG